MQKKIEITTMTARNVYSTESFDFIKKILKNCCDYEVPTKALEIHKQNRAFDYTDEYRLYGTKEKGIKYHSYYKLAEPTKSILSIYTVSNESFGFSDIWVKFTISTNEGLIFEFETGDNTFSKKLITIFENEYGYCRKQSDDEIFDELIHELRNSIMDGDGDYGIKMGNKAIKIYPDDFWARFYLGCSYALENQHEKAIEHFKIAVKVDPSNNDAWFNLARSYIELKDFKKAEEAMLKAYKLSKDNHAINYYLGIIYEALNDNKEAKKHYQKAISTAPDNKTSEVAEVKSYLKDAQKRISRL